MFYNPSISSLHVLQPNLVGVSLTIDKEIYIGHYVRFSSLSLFTFHRSILNGRISFLIRSSDGCIVYVSTRCVAEKVVVT